MRFKVDENLPVEALDRLVERLATLALAGHLCIIEDDRIRVRED